MDAPSPDLATHLIAVAAPDPEAQAEDGSMLEVVGDPVGYLGVVERSGQVEVDGESNRVISDDGFTVTVFAVDDPGMTTQAVISWSLLPPGTPTPSGAGLGPVPLPDGWAPQKVGYAIGDGSSVDAGCWAADVRSRT